MPGASSTEKAKAKVAVSRAETFRRDSRSGQVEDDRLERFPLIPKAPELGSGDCPERLAVLAAQNLNRSDRVYLDSTRSRHPSARMATARGVKVDRWLRGRDGAGNTFKPCGTVAATEGALR
jgi:hypothetical protein